MRAISVEHRKIRQAYRWFALLCAAALLYVCARYYPVLAVNSYYHPGEPNSEILVVCALSFFFGAYFIFVAAIGRWAPGPETSMAHKLALAASAIVVSLLAVVSVLAWDFRWS